jgi:serine/threonine-protein kinase HipA
VTKCRCDQNPATRTDHLGWQLDYRAKGVHDYSQFLGAMRQLKMSPKAFDQAFRRIVFNVIATNCDDHTKNISFILHGQNDW